VTDGPTDPLDDGTPPQTIMLTADLALLEDDIYRDLSLHFKDDIDDLTVHFKHAWYKLMSGDIGPVTRCHGPEVPPAQPFQWPLPEPLPEEQLADFNAVRSSILGVMTTENAAVLPMDAGGYGPLFVRLAWQCANPYRATDHKGGCNGARIRNLPQSGWSANTAMDDAMALLQPVKDKYGDGLSWADLIVLSGNVALEQANPKIALTFTGGRTDAPIDEKPDMVSDKLEVIINGGDQDDTIDQMMNMQAIWGFTFNEVVALIGGGHSLGRVHSDRSGFQSGQWTTNPNTLDTQFFHNLLNLDWTLINGDTDKMQYTSTAADGTPLQMLRSDMNLRFAMEYRAVAEQYLANEDLFFADFTAAWTKIMNQDRFDLTISEEDNTPSNDSGDDDDDISNTSVALIFGFVGAAIGVLITALAAHFVIYAPKSPSDGLKSPLNNDRGSVTDLRSSSYIPPVRPSEVGETL
jgi:catalase-peroxidase